MGLFLLVFTTLIATTLNGAKEISYDRDVRPILSDRCFHCHGPDKHDRKAELRLDKTDGPDGAYRILDEIQAIKPGDLEESEVWHRIISDDEDELMPPPDSHKKKLTKDEVNIIRQWIENGAEYEKFWAFKKPAIKSTKSKTVWAKDPIDQYVIDRLNKEKLSPKPEADKRTLLRRLTFDLTGLPPTLEELSSFIQDKSENAYEERVDELLTRPQYGEHMTRYWADLVRLADTNGLHTDRHRSFHAYRDWVIQSFNRNQPFDEFIRDQLAGDLYPHPTTDQLVASGFNRLNLMFEKGSVLPEESLYRNVLGRLEALGTAFLGLTVQCAECHDHKYDPISQKEFFQLYAFFNNLDGPPQTGPKEPNGVQEPSIDIPKEHTITAERAMVMKERNQTRKTFMRLRGAYDKMGEEVTRGTPAFLPPMKVAGDEPTRMDLANWLVAPEHPLTSRVTVNRLWQQFFGTGLVKTSEDFGAQGEFPSHPELLDYLAVRFVKTGWDTKKLIKGLVMSSTYKQQSGTKESEYKSDPENRLLARASSYRMDAEMIRDQILFVSGKLNGKLFGRSVKPPQPPGLWKSVTMTNEFFVADQGPDIYKRSLYTFWKRIMPPPQMSIMNAPSREFCVARRERTNTPLQALLLMNEPEYYKLAQSCAERTLSEAKGHRQKTLIRLYERITSHPPSTHDLALLNQSLDQFLLHYKNNPELAKQSAAAAKEEDKTAAWTLLAHSLLNLEAAKVRR